MEIPGETMARENGGDPPDQESVRGTHCRASVGRVVKAKSDCAFAEDVKSVNAIVRVETMWVR